VAFEVAGVLGVGVVAPLVRASVLVVPMANTVILVSRSSREVKSPRRSTRRVSTPNHCSVFSQDACLGVQVTSDLGCARGSSDRVAELDELALHPPVPPRRIAHRHVDHELADRGCHGGRPGRRRLE
jgi:hypothetical protein